MRDAGEMHDSIRFGDEWRPIDCRREIWQGRKLDTGRKTLPAEVPDGRADRVPGAVECGDKRAPDET